MPENQMFLVLNEDERDATLDYEVFDPKFVASEPEMVLVDSGQMQLDASKYYTMQDFVEASVALAGLEPINHFQAIDIKRFNTF